MKRLGSKMLENWSFENLSSFSLMRPVGQTNEGWRKKKENPRIYHPDGARSISESFSSRWTFSKVCSSFFPPPSSSIDRCTPFIGVATFESTFYARTCRQDLCASTLRRLVNETMNLGRETIFHSTLYQRTHTLQYEKCVDTYQILGNSWNI